MSGLNIYQSNPLNIDLKNPRISEPIVISDNTIQKIKFNVMNGKDVEEILFVKEYRIWDNGIEAIFNRDYYTEMAASPDHLIFLSALVNLQKMVYLYMHYYLGLEYSDSTEEKIKIWPTDLNLNMPKMIFDKEDVKHRMDIKSIKYVGDSKFYIIANTHVNEIVKINGKALAIIL